MYVILFTGQQQTKYVRKLEEDLRLESKLAARLLELDMGKNFV